MYTRTWLTRRRLVVVAAVASVSAVVASTPVRALQVKFSQRVVAASVPGGEPRVFTDKDPSGITHTYVVSPAASPTTIWSSTDGVHWRQAVTSGGGGDSDLAIDAHHTIWADDLLDGKQASPSSTIPISKSTNYGQTFAVETRLAPNASGLAYDRPWLAASGLTVVASALTVGDLVGPSEIDAWRIDATTGHVSGPKTVAKNVDVGGPIVALPGGGFAMAYEGTDIAGSDTAIFVADSKDGITWVTHQVADHETAYLFPVIAADASTGSRYVVWSGDVIGAAAPGGAVTTGGALQAIKLATQPPGHGWSKPEVLSDVRVDVLGDNPPAVLPWVVAAGGGVDVTYAIANPQTFNPPGFGGLPQGVADPSNLGGPNTTWDLVLAQSFSPTSAASWTRTVIATGFHTGSICDSGAACLGPQNVGFGNIPTPYDRRELDFFGSALDPAGNLLVPFGKDTPTTSDPAFPNVDLTLAHQTSGLALAPRAR